MNRYVAQAKTRGLIDRRELRQEPEPALARETREPTQRFLRLNVPAKNFASFRVLSGKSQFRNIEISGFVIPDELFSKRIKPSVFNRVPGPTHQIQIEMQVMQRKQPQTENFFRLHKVANVTARKLAAARTRAILFDRSFVHCEF